jgi:hypothetical protein
VAWVKAVVDGVEYNITFNGTWTASLNIGEGHHSLTVVTSDIWCNVGNATLEFTVNMSVRVIHLGNVTVIIVPGEGESNVSLINGTVYIGLELGGEGVAFKLPPRGLIILREGPYDVPWLAVESGARLSIVERFNKTVRRGGKVYTQVWTRISVNITGGYGVVALPIGDMRVRWVNITKNGTTHALGTNPESENYYVTAGGYLYLVLRSDPEVTVVLEKLNEEELKRMTSKTLRVLGFLWERYYLMERDEFEKKLRELGNATNSTALQQALKLHDKAKTYYRLAREHFFKNDWLRYAIYARKAYITVRRALELIEELEGEA